MNIYGRTNRTHFYVLRMLVSCVLLSAFCIPQTNAEDIEQIKKKCTMCHGADGNSPSSTIPSIAGITREFFEHTMDAYKNNGRQSDMMKSFVHSLTEEDIKSLADFFGKQEFKPRKQEFDPEKAKQGEKLHQQFCEKCHENAGRITENNYGILAGQWMPYLKQAINDYLDKKRRVNPMMIKKLEKLKSTAGPEGIDQIVNYYGSLQ